VGVTLVGVEQGTTTLGSAFHILHKGYYLS
jgi:hypothetical protein